MKKFLSVATIITTIALMVIIPSMYSKATEMVITEEGTATIPVTADVSAVFEVTIPSSINITNYNVKEFEIRGKGSISAYEYLEVALPDKIKMECEGEYSQKLKITTSDTRFTRDQLALTDGSVITCGIDASTLSSGEWTGNLDIAVAVKDLYYRLPDTISYNYSYTIAAKFVDGSIHIFNTEKPLYYYEPEGYYYAGTLNAKDYISGSRYGRYKEDSNGIWGQDYTGTFYHSSPFPCHQYTIIYSNYDIYHNSSGEIWQPKMCVD